MFDKYERDKYGQGNAINMNKVFDKVQLRVVFRLSYKVSLNFPCHNYSLSLALELYSRERFDVQSLSPTRMELL